jgi:hypothetical protein
VSPGVLELLYALTTIGLVVVGLVLVGMSTRAYVRTSSPAMMHLSVGFTLAIAGAAATMISAFITNFESVRSLLLVDSGLTTFGLVVVVYSLASYE